MSTSQKKVKSQKNDSLKTGGDTKKDNKSSKSKQSLAKRDDDEALSAENEDMVEEEDDEPEYEVEEIIEKKIKKGSVYYLVKWRGFSLDDCTWEPEENLEHAPLVISAFENKLLEKAKNASETKDKSTRTGPEKIETKDVSKASKESTNINNTSLLNPTEPESVLGKRSRDKFEGTKSTEQEDKKKNKKGSEKKKTSGGEKNSNKKAEKGGQDEKGKGKEKEEEEKSSPESEKDIQSQDKSPMEEEKSVSSEKKTVRAEETKNETKAASDSTNNTPQDSGDKTKKKENSGADKKLGNSEEGGTKAAPQADAGQLNTATTLNASQTKNKKTQNDQLKNKHDSAESNTLRNGVGHIGGIGIGSNTNKRGDGITLSRIMQDDKLMEGSETEPSVVDTRDAEANDQNLDNNKAADKKSKRKDRVEYGSLDKNDIPQKVIGIRPVKEENDLEVMVSWKPREDGFKPYNSKVMRLELLTKGHWMPLIEFYESKMKLESAPNFDPTLLPKYKS